jgi:hypothetical protein
MSTFRTVTVFVFTNLYRISDSSRVFGYVYDLQNLRQYDDSDYRNVYWQ